MWKMFRAPITAFVLLGVGLATPDMARANDRELSVVLNRLACVPAQAVRTDPSPILVVYEVTCKRSGRVLHVECFESECRLQTQSQEDNER